MNYHELLVITAAILATRQKDLEPSNWDEVALNDAHDLIVMAQSGKF
jgi:hypothetical protein